VEYLIRALDAVQHKLSENSRDEANVWIDSLQHYRLARGGSVEVSASPYPIVTVNRADEDTRDWLKALKGTCLSLHAPHAPHASSTAHLMALMCAGMNRFVEREYAGPDDQQ
jgi:hypothetical protein